MRNIDERDYAFDIMKGIGIFLMVAGHTLGPESILHNYIYAFHMPLFFLIAGYFVKPKNNVENIVSSFDRLIKPFLFICFIVVLINALHHYYNTHTINLSYDKIIRGVGPGWFLLALFWGRIIFNQLIRHFSKQYLYVALVISSIPTILHWSYPIFMPFCILQGLSCVIFLAIGYYVKQHDILVVMNRNIIPCIIISLLLWLNTSIFGAIEMSDSYYKLWVLDYMGAIGGSFLCYCFAKYILLDFSILNKILITISIYSLSIYSFHTIDFCIPIWHYLVPIVGHDYLVISVILIRFLFFIPIIFITYRIPFLFTLFVRKK